MDSELDIGSFLVRLVVVANGFGFFAGVLAGKDCLEGSGIGVESSLLSV